MDVATQRLAVAYTQYTHYIALSSEGFQPRNYRLDMRADFMYTACTFKAHRMN